MRDTAAGMANVGGGFIVLGVTDDRKAASLDRLVGIDGARDLARDLSNITRAADPSIPFLLKSPSIALPSRPGKVIAVVHVLGIAAPHASQGIFHIRDGGGSNRRMTTSEVRALIIKREEIVQRLRLLLQEIAAAREAAISARLAKEKTSVHLLHRPDTRMLADLHASVLPLLAEHPEISKKLSALRAHAEGLNFQLDAALRVLFGRDREKPPRESFDFLIGIRQTETIPRLGEQLVGEIAERFGVERPPLRSDAEIAREFS